MSICLHDRTSQYGITNSTKVPKFYIAFLNGERIALDFVPTITVAEVLNLIQDTHDIENQMLEFKGKPLQLHRNIAECGVNENSILRLVTRNPKMRIIVILPDGDIAALEVEHTDTIIRVKEKLQEQYRIRETSHYFLTNGLEVLKDTETLAHYNVQNWHTLSLSSICLGGSIGFEFNSLSEVVKKEFDSSAPDWRTVYHGLNFFSTCLEPDCRAFNDRIIVSKGFGIFDIGEVSCQLQCPQCHKSAKNSTNCEFYMAKWEFCGRLQNGEERKKSGVADSNHYYTFKECDNVSWRYLRVTVSTLPVSKPPEPSSCLPW